MNLPELEYQGVSTQITDPKLRGSVMGRFFHAAQNLGIKDPKQLVDSVIDSAITFLVSDEPDSRRKERLITASNLVLKLIEKNPAGALEVAAYYIDRQSWMKEKKEQLRHQQFAIYGDRKMSRKEAKASA